MFKPLSRHARRILLRQPTDVLVAVLGCRICGHIDRDVGVVAVGEQGQLPRFSLTLALTLAMFFIYARLLRAQG